MENFKLRHLNNDVELSQVKCNSVSNRRETEEKFSWYYYKGKLKNIHLLSV
jgi:hypothetical protein